jgi:hypothetical protein
MQHSKPAVRDNAVPEVGFRTPSGFLALLMAVPARGLVFFLGTGRGAHTLGRGRPLEQRRTSGGKNAEAVPVGEVLKQKRLGLTRGSGPTASTALMGAAADWRSCDCQLIDPCQLPAHLRGVGAVGRDRQVSTQLFGGFNVLMARDENCAP